MCTKEVSVLSPKLNKTGSEKSKLKKSLRGNQLGGVHPYSLYDCIENKTYVRKQRTFRNLINGSPFLTKPKKNSPNVDLAV